MSLVVQGEDAVFPPVEAENPLRAGGRREQILALIREDPGATQRQLQERTYLAWSTVAYHVDRLVEAGLVERHALGRRRALYASGLAPESRTLRAALRDELTRDIHALLRRRGEMRAYRVARAVAMGAPAVRRKLKAMEEAGLVRRRGNHVALYSAVPISKGPATAPGS